MGLSGVSGLAVQPFGGGLLPFSDMFNRANGPLVAPWQSGGATWAVAGNEAVNTPTEGGDVVTNGDFSAWTGDDPDNWNVFNEDVNNYVTESVAGGEARIVSNNTAVLNMAQTEIGFGLGNWGIWRFDAVAVVAGTVRANSAELTGGQIDFVGVGAKVRTDRATNANVTLRFYRSGVCDYTIDNVSFSPLTLNTLFSSVATSTADVVCQVELDTVVAGTQAGLVLNLDDKDTPANFVIAYHDGTNCVLEKCVAGIYTPVITAAAAYVAGATIQVTKSGADYTLTYNGVQVGATSTINNAEIVSNTLHGMFNTYSGNRLDNFECVGN